MTVAIKNRSGFTLIEVLITMAVFSIIIAAVVSAHTSQQNTYMVQEQVVEMQQNLRSAMHVLTAEIRMAGYDPTGTANAGITEIFPGRMRLTKDIDENGTTVGDPNETIDIGFSIDWDADGNGIPDTVIDGVPDAISIDRQTGGGGGFQPVADDMQAVEFLYFDSDGIVTAVPGEVASVQVTLLARARLPDPDFTNTTVYVTPSGQRWGPYNDNYRRRMLTTAVRCRNMGL